MNSEMAPNNGILTGKHPTRLQKQAPATLQLDHEIHNNFSKTVIPFLSPLVLSPPPLPESIDDAKRSFAATPNTNNHAIGIIPQVQQSGGGGSGWKHPAMAGPMADTSSLYAYFHSQCTILPRNQ